MGFWIPAAMAAAGALMGHQKHQREKEIEDQDRKLASATARYSPWTGMAPGQIRRAGSAFGSIGQGALSGAMFGSQFGGGGAGGGVAAEGAGAAGSNTLGGQDMAAQMGQDYGPGAFSSWDQMQMQKPPVR